MNTADYIKEVLSLMIQIDQETELQTMFTFFGKLNNDINIAIRDKGDIVLTRCAHLTPEDYQYTINRLYSILQ